ncbi:MAG: hypothetical protein SOZ59_04385 [Candidatus Limivivens sp.]|nr:hypothetical protein [Candidatus Limivivens sp.]
MNGKECRTIRVLNREIRIHILDTGRGINVLIEGGDLGHIGAVAAAGAGRELTLVSFPGHREDVICRQWAEKISAVYPGPVVIEAGVHYDGISRGEIQEILEALGKELDTLVRMIESGEWKK